MLLRDEDTVAFRQWLLPKLDKISDADAEVLADYVMALVAANETEGNLKKNCLESLEDFLQDNTAAFVHDLVDAVRTKIYRPQTPTKTHAKANGTKPQSWTHEHDRRAAPTGPIAAVAGTSTFEYAPDSSRVADAPTSHAPDGPSASRATAQAKAQHHLHNWPTAPSLATRTSVDGPVQQASKKRKQGQRDASEARDGKDSHYIPSVVGQRPVKQPIHRTGKNTLRGSAVAFQPSNTVAGYASLPAVPMLNLANLPPPPPGPMPFDMVNNPMAFLAMMAALGTNMTGMPQMPLNNMQSNSPGTQTRQGKCYDYHEKGFCARGDMCAFQHSGGDEASDHVPEYDPGRPSLGTHFETHKKHTGRYRTYNSRGKGGKARASISAPGPSYDSTNTTLVIEQIPEEHFSEDCIRDFFCEFGTLDEIHMYAYKRLAAIKFKDHAAANRAYMSPKAVFDNRFVKVYWYRSGSHVEAANGPYEDVDMGGNIDYEDDGRGLHPEEIAKRQAEAQKDYEERRKKREETEARAADVERKLQEKDAEMRKIRQQLAELAGDSSGGSNEYSQDLATLAAEAESLFAQKPSPPGGRGSGYAFRGGDRSRIYGPFPRGRGGPQGSYRGRGRGRGAVSSPFVSSRSSVKRLDNRPRRLAVASIEAGTPREEALRQYLLNVPECNNIEAHPEQPDMLILTFQQRYEAEMFLDKSHRIPDTGPLELSWVPNDAFGGVPASTTTSKEIFADSVTELEGDTNDDSSQPEVTEEVISEDDDDEHVAELDMDVADDVDRWL